MTRIEIAIQAAKNNEIQLDTLGQLAGSNFTDEIINRAVERGWISEAFAQKLLNV